MPAAPKEYSMTEINDILSRIDINQVASRLGTDPASARSAVEAALPTLLAGMQDNVRAPGGSASLESALAQHRNGLLEGGVDAARVDTADGEKIVGHVFGGREDQVASQLAGTATLGSVGSDLIRKVLPILAPIVMSYLARKIFGGQAGAGSDSTTGRPGGGIDLGSILGGMLGGRGAGAEAGASGGAQGSILDSILEGLGGALGSATPSATPGATREAPSPAEAPPAEGPGDDLRRRPGQSSVQPGEVIDVDFEARKPAQPAKEGGGPGGILGDLFGKK
jgi:hypothetical protein